MSARPSASARRAVRPGSRRRGQTTEREVSMFRYRIYQELGKRKGEFLQLVEKRAKRVGMPKAWAGTIGLTGSNSARPAYLRRDVIRSMSEGARSSTNLINYLEDIRIAVKE